MDNFSKDAFDKAEKQRLEAEANAWASVPDIEKIAIDKAALLAAGTSDSAALIALAIGHGLVETLHCYAYHCMMGGKVRKGAKAGMVVFFKSLLIEDKENIDPETGKAKTKTVPYLQYYNVFHLDDVEGIDTKIVPGEAPEVEPIEAAEKVITDYLRREGHLRFQNDKPSNRAYYSPTLDEVVVPMLSQYEIPEEYYSTTFHELTHSTLKADRCDRVAENANAHFGNEVYSREELVAEIGSAMICNRVGIEVEKAFRNSVAYIKGWLRALKDDPKMIVWAASRAEKAARFIINEV